jgi:hypothetical protein
MLGLHSRRSLAVLRTMLVHCPLYVPTTITNDRFEYEGPEEFGIKSEWGTIG